MKEEKKNDESGFKINGIRIIISLVLFISLLIIAKYVLKL
jgi:hypothetical protein